ncbi:mediator complex subunit [Lambiella insularis]|nr:mediator complex subunit [Lambiella insularis]
MPGVLKRPDSRSNHYPDMNTADAVGLTVNGQGSKKRKADEMVNGDALANGGLPVTNGVYANGAVADPAVSPENLSAVVQDVSTQLPPEIEHITQGYVPLSMFITRLAQETFLGLTETINQMADMQPQQSNAAPHTNGVAPGQNSQPNVDKKNILWDFAHARRANFIKILVLSQWSRNVEAVGKVIDLNVWLNGQKEKYRQASSWLGELKRLLGPAKLPSPDLRTALEALSTGKAAWLPDLGYLPPEPLTPKRLMKALRTINTLLTIRLNLHETIPPGFRKFSISSGRATFRVEGEFELDLSIADEDPSSQLFFIDFRFLFSPCMTELPEGHLRNEIEGKTNHVLRTEGLSACYDFLHDLILTHKLRILRSQAVEMMRGRWSEGLKLELVRRNFVLQYWPNRPGGKNWIEIGVKRGKPKKRLFLQDPGTPCISLRWHRHGKEILDFDVDLQLEELSMESILKQIIALHTNYIFRETKKKLRESPIYAQKLFLLKHRASEIEPSECSLKVQLTSSTTVTILQEPASGAFAFLPPTHFHSVAEQDLNRLVDPASAAASKIAFLRCVSAVAQVMAFSRNLAWQELRMHNPSTETVKKYFNKDVTRLAFFRPAPWPKEWSLALTTGTAGDIWWAVEMREVSKHPSPAELALGQAQPIKTTFKVPTSSTATLVTDPTYSLLSNIENTAAAAISQYLDANEVGKEHIRRIKGKPRNALPKVHIPDQVIYYPKLNPISTNAKQASEPPWCHELIKSSFIGLTRSRSSVVNLISARLLVPIPNVHKLTTDIDCSLAFHPTTGALCFRLNTPIGKTSILDIRDRFARISRLIRFLAIIRRHNLPCQSISLTNLAFSYATDLSGPLTANIKLATDAPMRIEFALHNPHLRIQDFLTSMLAATSGFESVTSALRLTLPLLLAFAAVEASERKPGSGLHILPRSATWYRVRYENPLFAYEIRLRQRREQALWFSKTGAQKEGSTAAEEAWLQLCRERGAGWQGMKGGITAEVEGVQALVRRIDEVFRGLRSEAGGAVAGESGEVLDVTREVEAERRVAEAEKMKGKEIVEID